MKLILLLLALLLTAAISQAQTDKPQTPPPAPPPPLVSPEVQADHRVTFRFRAPNAKEVSVAIEGMERPLRMNKMNVVSGQSLAIRSLPITTDTPSSPTVLASSILPITWSNQIF